MWRPLKTLSIPLFSNSQSKNSKILCLQLSPEPFVSRAKAPPAKRSEKGYGDKNGLLVVNLVYSKTSDIRVVGLNYVQYKNYNNNG